MENARMKQFFETVLKDEETAKALMAKTPEEVSAYCAEQGLTYSAEEIKEYGAELQKKIDAVNSGELEESALEDVSGGKGEFGAGVAFGMLIGVAFLGGW